MAMDMDVGNNSGLVMMQGATDAQGGLADAEVKRAMYNSEKATEQDKQFYQGLGAAAGMLLGGGKGIYDKEQKKKEAATAEADKAKPGISTYQQAGKEQIMPQIEQAFKNSDPKMVDYIHLGKSPSFVSTSEPPGQDKAPFGGPAMSAFNFGFTFGDK